MMGSVKILNNEISQNGKIKWGVFDSNGILIANRRNKSDAMRLLSAYEAHVSGGYKSETPEKCNL